MGDVTVEDRREKVRRSEDCIQSDRLDRLEKMILGPDGWMAYQKMVIRELEQNTGALNRITEQQNNMLANQSAMGAELRSLKKTAAGWGGGLGAFLGAIAAALWSIFGSPG